MHEGRMWARSGSPLGHIWPALHYDKQTGEQVVPNLLYQVQQLKTNAKRIKQKKIE